MRKETGEKHKFQLASLSQVRAITHTGCFAPLVTSSIRYGRITSRLVTFKSKVKGLVHRLKTQGFKFEDLRIVLSKSKHYEIARAKSKSFHFRIGESERKSNLP